MEEKLQMLLKQIDMFKDNINDFEGGKLEKIIGNKSKTEYRFYITLKENLKLITYLEFEEKLKKKYSDFEKINAYFNVETKKEEYIKDYYNYFLDLYSKNSPLLAMFKDRKISYTDNKLTLELLNKAEEIKLNGTKNDLEKSFKRAGYDLEIEIKIDEEKNKELREEINKELEINIPKETIKKDLAVQKYRENFEQDLKVTDKEVEKYYKEHKDDFKEESVEAYHILVSTLDDNNKPVDDSKKEELKSKAESLLKEIKNGGDFEKIAKENSDDKSSGKKGGYLGYFTKDSKNAQFTKEAFKLEKGQVSNVFETPFGYEIVKVTNKKTEQKSLEDSREEIVNRILADKYLDQVNSLREKSDVQRF